MYWLSNKLEFPPVSSADKEGLLAIGGDLTVQRLQLAYQSGIFPWFDKNQPILWWSPNPRMFLFPDRFKISKSFKQTLRNHTYSITWNKAFLEVITQCASLKRKDQEGTWITQEMIDAYMALHKKGWAVSIEVWDASTLVGGLYGIDLKEQGVFCGESMFSLKNNTSKIALYHLVEHIKNLGYKGIDCQMHTTHLERLGAIEIERDRFIQLLQ